MELKLPIQATMQSSLPTRWSSTGLSDKSEKTSNRSRSSSMPAITQQASLPDVFGGQEMERELNTAGYDAGGL